MRKYPEPSDYQAAIQNPNLVLREPELRAATVKVDRLGLPVVSSGGYALSYGLLAPNGSQWVVRCFKADSPDRRGRYDAISRFIDAHPDPILLDVDYAEEGILVNGAWYPIVKMPLVRGVTLQRYIEAELDAGRSVAHLSRKFRAVVAKLEQLGIAHGDLQHGNIMVQNGQLVLVDYDGMYVPALHGWPTAEMGSAAYQHPLRRRQFGPELDRFSAIVIDMALQALAFAPGLWRKYDTGENLLFRQADFTSPDYSPLLRDLEQIPHLAPAVRKLRAVCKGPFDAIPRLGDVLPPLPDTVQPVALRATAPAPSPRSQSADVDAQLTRLYSNWQQQPQAQAQLQRPAPPQPATPITPQPNWSRALATLDRATRPSPPLGPMWLQRLQQVVVVASMTFGLSILLAGVVTGSIWRSRPARQAYVEPTPFRYAVPTLAAPPIAPETPLPPGPCPEDLAVTMLEPSSSVYGAVARFIWVADRRLPGNCTFQFHLRHINSDLIDLAPRPIIRTTGGYTRDVHYAEDVPPNQQYPGEWVAELEIVDSASGAAIPLKSAPYHFFWLDPGSTVVPS